LGDDTDEGRVSGTHPKRSIVDVVSEVGERLRERKRRPMKRRVRVTEPELDEASGA